MPAWLNSFWRLKKMQPTEAAYHAGAAAFIFLILTLASFELLFTPGALFRRVTPALAGGETSPTSGDLSAADQTSGSAVDPYASVLDAFKSQETKSHEDDERREQAARVLQKSIRESNAAVGEGLERLTQKRAAHLQEIKKVVGTSLDSTQLPNDFASLLVKQPTVAEAWASMKNDRVSDTEISENRAALSEISDRIAKNSFLQSDLSRLGGLKNSIDKNIADEQDSEDSLEHIRPMLDGERFHLAR